MKLIGRLIWVAIAAVLSALAGACVGFVIGLERLTTAVLKPGTDQVDPLDLLQMSHDVVQQFSGTQWPLSVVPAIALVIAGEVMGIRSFLYYVAGGGIALVGLPVLANAGLLNGQAGALPTVALQVLAVTGFAAGFAYWALAGRRA